MQRIIVAVCDPPQPGLPYLGVIITPNGQISAIGFATAAEAEAYTEAAAKNIVADVSKNEVHYAHRT
jgi:hypothetical protein